MHIAGPFHVLLGQLNGCFAGHDMVKATHITLNVVSQTGPLRVNGLGGSGVCALDVDVVVGTIVQLQGGRRKR